MKNAKEISELRKSKLQSDKERINNFATKYLAYHDGMIEKLLIDRGHATVDIRKPTEFSIADSDQWRSLSAADYMDVYDEISNRYRKAGFLVRASMNCQSEIEISLPQAEEDLEYDNTDDHDDCGCSIDGRIFPRGPNGCR